MARRHRRHRSTDIAAALALAGAFVAVHCWLVVVGLSHPSGPFQDVTVVYSSWIDAGLSQGLWVVIDESWVYPFAALAPMLAASAFGPDQYGVVWLLMVLLLDAGALGVLTSWGTRRDRLALGWWWTAFLGLLGPVAIGRIDAVTVPLAVIAMSVVVAHPRIASTLLTIAAWMKIWPGAVVLAVVVASRFRAKVLIAAMITTTVVVVVALAFGAGQRVLSFIAEQADRGIQIESLVAVPWMWAVATGAADTTAYFDQRILTFQVSGPGTEIASAVMTPLLVLVLVAVTALGITAARARAPEQRVVAALALALVAVLIVVNKVGSPQFMVWFVAPVLFGMLVDRSESTTRYRIPATLVLLIAALTQVIYPYLYGYLVAGNPVMVLVLAVRNALVVAVAVWAVRELVHLSRHAGKLEGTTTPTTTPTTTRTEN